ncbi:MAG TPA: hypothetical protein VHK63_01055 [Candidatus Limnocylindria bacterium]|nr:hypothetical protein [Candidatus Limnocylindria bacterium]
MPVPVARYAIVALLGLGAVLAVVLLVRPFIFTFAVARDDGNYPVAEAARVDAGPILAEVVLEEGHGIPGAVQGQDGLFRLAVVAAQLPGQEAYSVVNAWSRTNQCRLSLGADRLVDCQGDAWTYQGVPLDAGDPFLDSFATDVRQGVIVVDFTQPMQTNP